MTKFFLPYASDEAIAEHTLAAIKRFALETTTWQASDRCLFYLWFRHGGRNSEYTAQVGQQFSLIHHETVVAILECPQAEVYLICTATQGVVQGCPFVVAKDSVLAVEEFER